MVRALRPIAMLALLMALSCLIIRETSAQDSASQASSQPKEAPILDPFDPFDILGSEEIVSSANDEQKSAEDLLRDSELLLLADRPLDARTKLLKALKKDPDNYRAYHLLAGYYLVHVGHYRLALKYIKRAEELFEKMHGPPPYTTRLLQFEHGNILYYLSQIRLNLDNYQGALEALDRYQALSYHGEWYPGSRAWVLMKLGNIQEAIRIARLGVLAGEGSGQTLNMLGILLSMNDQSYEALEVFRKAIATEMSLGNEGQPATPLNNSGEVYKELFEDDKAESTFLRATSYPDGCEHILPSLNLALLYIDQMKFEAAAGLMDAFDRCVAQFPLRNNEEHLTLESLVRGRIDLHTGDIKRAIRRFEASLEGTQWFGKIGTNQNDMLVASTISLAQALKQENNILRSRVPSSWSDWLRIKETLASNGIRSWWLLRRAQQMLIADLKEIEDLTIRNTDSLLEYPTLGDTLSGISSTALKDKLQRQVEIDRRPAAQLFYTAYLAQSSLGWFNQGQANALLDEVIERARPNYDELLRTHAILLRMRSLKSSSERYRDLAYRIFYTAPAELRNSGFKLPVRIESVGMGDDIRAFIERGPFLAAENSALLCSIRVEPTATLSTLSFSCPGNSAKNRIIGDVDPRELVNKLAEALFREEISNGSNN